MNNMYRIQQNTTANIETYEYFGSVHCDLFGTCPHQNLSSNSWHPPHPVDWTNLQQSFNHHLQLKKKTASTAVPLSHPQYPNSAPLFGGSRDSMSLAWSALWLRLVSLGRWNQQHWQQWVTSEDLGTFRMNISHLTHHPASKLIKQSKAYKILRYVYQNKGIMGLRLSFAWVALSNMYGYDRICIYADDRICSILYGLVT